MADTTTLNAETMIDFGHQNVEALMRSGQILAAGLQSLGSQIASASSSQVEQAMAAMRQMSAVKSVKDAIDLQAGLVRASLDTMVAQGGKLSDASIKLAEQAMQPITARVAAATAGFRPQV